MHIAIDKNDEKTVQIILKQCQKIAINEPNKQGIFKKIFFYNTVLHLACNNYRCSSSIVKLLLSYRGIDVNIPDSKGRSPIMIAQENSQREIVQLLINDYRTNLNVKDILNYLIF